MSGAEDKNSQIIVKHYQTNSQTSAAIARRQWLVTADNQKTLSATA